MTGQLLNLEATPHKSRVLDSWMAGRDGAAERAGIVALGENSSGSMSMGELANLLGAANRSVSGKSVTESTAMRVSAVYGCIARLVGAISSLPVGVYERSEKQGRAPAEHPYWWFLNEQANPEMSAATAWKVLINRQLCDGDGFAELLRPSFSSGNVKGWHPRRMQPFREGGKFYYRVFPAGGGSYVLPPDDVIHLKSLGFNDETLLSPSPLCHAALDIVGTAIAGQEYAGQFFGGAANFDYALKTASKLDKAQLEQLKASLIARAQNGGRGPLILSGGLEPAQLSVNSKDAEILATRLFTVEEICRVFGVPPHMVGHTEKTSSWGTGMAEQGGNFVRYVLNDRLNEIKQEFNRRLWPTGERFFIEHKTEALERGDQRARFEAYRIALGRAGEQPFMDATEIRRLENMPPNANLITNGGTSVQKSDQAPGEQQEAA
jgi:HK97 family phage portal protein